MDGSTPWEVDEAMVAFGFKLGPFEAQDLAGIDVARAGMIAKPGRRHVPLVSRMYELGKLGKKTGAGWYRYPGGNGKVEDPIVADLALEESHFAGRIRTDYTEDEIQERLLLALFNEAAELMAQGYSAAEIGLVSVTGLGFPKALGGLVRYADTLGAGWITEQLQMLAQEDPVVWKPSSVLERCANEGLALSADEG